MLGGEHQTVNDPDRRNANQRRALYLNTVLTLVITVAAAVLIGLLTSVQQTMGSLEQHTISLDAQNRHQQAEIGTNAQALKQLAVSIGRLSAQEEDTAHTLQQVQRQVQRGQHGEGS